MILLRRERRRHDEHRGQSLEPFDQCRLSTALSRVYSDPRRRDALSAMLGDIAGRYERRRKQGDHDGPPLTGARAYLMRWDVVPDAANRETPSSRLLLAEVTIDPTTERTE